MLLFVVSSLITKTPEQAVTDNAIAANSASQNMQVGVFAYEGEKFVAHRGYSNYAPENSIPAFEFAGKMGFWDIETDISQTADGNFICMHDEEIDRTTTGSGAVGNLTMEQINSFTIDKGNYIKKAKT